MRKSRERNGKRRANGEMEANVRRYISHGEQAPSANPRESGEDERIRMLGYREKLAVSVTT